MDSYKKENKDLKEKVNSLQIELTEKEVSESARRGVATLTIHAELLWVFFFSAVQPVFVSITLQRLRQIDRFEM